MDKIIVPFGEECYTCQSIDSKFSNSSIRKSAFPFDYVGHTFIEKIYNNICDLFKNDKYIDITINDFEIKNFDNKYYFCHKKYEFKYWHDISSNDGFFTDNDCNNFIEKYNRRYKRFYDTIMNCNDLHILSVNHFDNVYNKISKESEIYKLYDLLYSYNNNIKIIAINFGNELYVNPNILLINLPVNYNLPFSESKIQFTECLYEFVNKIYT